MARAPFSYYGGKMGMAQRIIGLMPPHRVYVEPFFGSGAVFFRKPRAPHEIINDLDDRIVTFFKVLRDRTDELEAVCALTPYARTEFYNAAVDDEPDELEIARRFWVAANQSFAKSAHVKKTGWSITTARNSSAPASVLSRIGRFRECAERLSGVTIENRDAVELLEWVGARPSAEDTLVYVDPPYLGSTRVRGSAAAAGDYLHDMPDENQHRRLAEVLNGLTSMVVVSGYPSPLYDALYADWNAIDFEVVAHSSNASRSKRSGRVERLWLNFDGEKGQGSLFAV